MHTVAKLNFLSKKSILQCILIIYIVSYLFTFSAVCLPWRNFWTKYAFCHSVPHQPCSSSQSSLLPSKAMIGHKGHTKAKHALLHSHSKRVNRTESRKAKLETKRTQNQNVPQRQFRTWPNRIFSRKVFLLPFKLCNLVPGNRIWK